MPNPCPSQPDYTTLQLDGRAYVVLRVADFEELCRAAGVGQTPKADPVTPSGMGELNPFDWDRKTLAVRIRNRRLAAGLTQTQLAHDAGIRPETLNRIERGKTEPDFTTIRKLVHAMQHQAVTI